MHELDTFDELAFWQLLDAATAISRSPFEFRDPIIRTQISRVHQAVLMLIIYHFNPLDTYKMNAFPSDDLYRLIDSLNDAVSKALRNL